MAMNRRLWRVMRGVSRSVGDSLRRPDRSEQKARKEVEQARAEMDARAEIEGRSRTDDLVLPNPPADRLKLPETPSTGERDREASVSLDLGRQATTAPGELTPHYAALDLPPTATLEQVGHAYRRLKARCDPEQFAGDPVRQARARQEEARLDEAYLTIRGALVRERRL